MSSKGTKYTATLPDGTVATRTSPRHYEYVIAVSGERVGGPSRRDPSPDSWGAWGWSSRRDLADKEAARAARIWSKVQVVPVDDPDDDAPAIRAQAAMDAQDPELDVTVEVTPDMTLQDAMDALSRFTR